MALTAMLAVSLVHVSLAPDEEDDDALASRREHGKAMFIALLKRVLTSVGVTELEASPPGRPAMDPKREEQLHDLATSFIRTILGKFGPAEQAKYELDWLTEAEGNPRRQLLANLEQVIEEHKARVSDAPEQRGRRDR